MTLFKHVQFIVCLLMMQWDITLAQEFEDTVNINGNITKVTWTWNNDIMKYESHPICFYRNEFQYRTHGPDFQYPDSVIKCDNLQYTYSKCPPGYTFHRRLSICYLFTENHKGPRKCPYECSPSNPENLFIWFNDLTNLAGNGYFWLPVKRNTSNGFGLFETLTNLPVSMKQINVRNTEDGFVLGEQAGNNVLYKYVELHDCAFFNLKTKTISTQNCNWTWPSFCICHTSESITVSVKNKSTNCKYVANAPNQCFYTVNSLSTESLRNDQFCEFPDHLAEPRLENQNELLDSVTNDGCWINLMRNQGKSVWISDNAVANYTNWIYNRNFLYTYGGSRNYSRSNFWRLYKTNNELNCAHCQRNLHYDNLKLTLKNKNATTGEIILGSANFTDIRDFNVVCLTNSRDALIETVNLTYTNSNSYTFKKIEFGSYWCRGFLYGFPLINSNTLQRIEEDQFFPGSIRYVPIAVHAMVYANVRQWIDITEVNTLKLICSYLIGKYFNRTEHIRCHVMRINKLPSEVTTSYKFIFKITTPYIEDHESFVKQVFERNRQPYVASGTSQNIVIKLNVTEVLQTTCRNTLTTYKNRTLEWPYTKPGETVFKIVENNCTVNRTCLGDLVDGAYWSNISEAKCQPEILERCPMENTFQEHFLHWPETIPGETASINDGLCFNKQPPYKDPVFRKCLPGGVWGNATRECREKHMVGSKTIQIYKVLHDVTKNKSMTLGEIETLTRNSSELNSQDIDVLAHALKLIDENGTQPLNLEAVNKHLQIASNLMNVNRTSLQETQRNRNTTDYFLDLVDSILLRSPLGGNGLLTQSTENFISQVCNLSVNKFAWMSANNIIGTSSNQNHPTNKKPVWTNIENEDQGDLESDLLVQVPEFIDPERNKSITPILAVTVFKTDTFFNDMHTTSQGTVSENMVVSVTAEGARNEKVAILGPFEIKFKARDKICKKSCAFWDYGSGKHGKWNVEPMRPKYKTVNNTSYVVCTFNHTTHFTVLVGVSVDSIHMLFLDIITTTGCTLSSLGVIAIIITTLIFKTWRNDNGHCILIQFSTIILLKYLLLYLASKARSTEADDCDGQEHQTKISNACLVTGVMLHYMLLAEFTWMLLLALLQYKRFVQIFKPASSESILAFSIAGWVIPIIPALIVFITNNYILAEKTMENPELCYPVGMSLYLGILLPILVIIVINLLIFGVILWSIAKSKAQLMEKRNVVHQQSILKLSLKLAIFLFFLLGLSWIFGLLAAMNIAQLVFSYLFCATGTLQGVVMFMYFIVWNEKIRNLWVKMLSCNRFKEKFDLLTNKSNGTCKSTSVQVVTFRSQNEQLSLLDSNDKHD